LQVNGEQVSIGKHRHRNKNFLALRFDQAFEKRERNLGNEKKSLERFS